MVRKRVKKKMAKKSKFNGLMSSQFKRPNKWKLTKSLTFKTDLFENEIALFKKHKVDLKWNKDTLTVPKGYITDMASVPRAAWAFILPPFGLSFGDLGRSKLIPCAKKKIIS